MQVPTLKASRRELSGTKAMRKLRADGGLPGVLYGKGEGNINLQFDYGDIEKLVHDASHVVELDFGDGKQTALVRGLQRDHLGDFLHHIDFIRISLDDKVKLRLPLNFVGTPRGASHGGLLEVLRGDVEVHCPASNIPKYIEVEVTQLEVEESVKFKDLNLPEGADLIPNPEGIVVKCAQARRAAALTKAQELQEAAKGAKPAAGAAAAPAKKSEAKK
ncbi:MAG: 50S ribosomal protein L25 [Planctomycetes bacterium]|nr:50S ribosomal protein L25 [Planctomycetota bacterium]